MMTLHPWPLAALHFAPSAMKSAPREQAAVGYRMPQSTHQTPSSSTSASLTSTVCKSAPNYGAGLTFPSSLCQQTVPKTAWLTLLTEAPTTTSPKRSACVNWMHGYGSLCADAMKAQGETTTQVAVGPLSLDPLHHEATYKHERIKLTPKEFCFLAYLARHVDKVCTRRMILNISGAPGISANTTI
jgi:hypothetical protein